MGRRPAYGLVGLPFALTVWALARAALAQEQPVVVPSAEAPPAQAAPSAAPAEPSPAQPPSIQAPIEAPPVQAPAPPPVETPPIQAPLEQPPEIVEAAVLGFGPPPRPRLSLAVGMGATRDPTGFPDGGHFIPAFFGVGGFGDGLVGVDLGAFSSAASGRFPNTDSPVDRLALDAFGVFRPAARLSPADQRYRMRVLRTLGLELGLGFERDGQVVVSGSRWVIHTGARIEFPLTSGQASELRLRLAVRRAFGLYTPELSTGSASNSTISVGDSTELYGALAVVF
jgi:hypothetical protein